MGKSGSRSAGGDGSKGPGKSTTIDRVIRVSIPSSFQDARDVQQQIVDAIEQHKFNAQSTFAIKLALEEALVNAIKHGNKLDENKRVHVHATVTPLACEIIIEDEGPGFDRGRVPDPTAEENLEKCSGRGILLIEEYMHEVSWSNGGRRIRLVRKNENIPDQPG